MGRVIRSLVPTAGSLPEVDLTRLRGPYELPPPRRWFKHKRWQYGMVSTPNVLAVFSVADLTYIANAFACAVDLTAKKLLFDRGWMGVPGPWISVGNRPGLNARARFMMPEGRGLELRLHAGLSRPPHRLAVGVCEWSAQRWTDHRLQHGEGKQRRSRAKRERSVDWFETDSAGSGSIYVQSEQSHG